VYLEAKIAAGVVHSQIFHTPPWTDMALKRDASCILSMQASNLLKGAHLLHLN